MQEAVENRIGEGGLADEFMPVLDRDLAGDEGGLEFVAVLAPRS